MKGVQIISNLTIGEQCALFKTLEQFYESQAEILSENAKLKSFFSELFQKNEAVIEASNKGDNSQNLNKVDGERDEAVRKFFAVLEGSAAQVDEAEAAAAENVLSVMNNYGRKIAGLSFSEETTKIESLLKDLESAALAKDLKRVHGGEAAKERLRTAQDNFLKVYAEKALQVTSQASEKNATVLKNELRDFYNQSILEYLQALCVIEGEKYTAFAKMLDEEVSRVNSKSRRQKQTQSKSDLQK